MTRRLMICDDEVALGRLVSTVAQRQGFEVCVTTSGEELFARYDQFKPDIILLDMVMPEMEGNEVISRLAGSGCSARVIIMTGYHAQYADSARILAKHKGLGAVLTLNKPFGITDLIAALEAGETED